MPDPAQDHLVRKIFSKFRKPSEASVATAGAAISRPGSSQPKLALKAAGDPEQGRRDGAPSISDFAKKRQSQQSVEPIVTGAADSRGSSAASKSSRWAALTGGTRDNNNIAAAFDDRDGSDAHTRRTELVCRKSEHIQVVKDIRPPTQGNKWPKVSPSARPETIDETSEPTADGQSKQSGEKPKHVVGTAIATSTAVTTMPPIAASSTSTAVVQPQSINNADYQQIIASLIDMRVDLKLEIQKLSNKVVKIDQHIEDVTKKLFAIHGPAATAAAAVPSSSVPTTAIANVISPTSRAMPLPETSAKKKEGSKLSRPRAPAPSGKDGKDKDGKKTPTPSVPPEQQPPAGAGDEVRAMMESEIDEQDSLEITSEGVFV